MMHSAGPIEFGLAATTEAGISPESILQRAAINSPHNLSFALDRCPGILCDLTLAYPVDFRDAGSRHSMIRRVLKDQVHSAPYKPRRQRPCVGRAFDLHGNRFRTIYGVTRNMCPGLGGLYNLIATMFRFHFKRGAVCKVVQVDAVLTPGLHRLVINFFSVNWLWHRCILSKRATHQPDILHVSHQSPLEK